MTQALARKWRPRKFAEMVGQEHVVRALVNALSQNRLHHAYLFTGTRGVGKTTLARIVAKALNCAIGITPEPCGVCSACQEIDAGRFVDLLELDAASNTQVDQMRDLLENALYAPTSGRFKVYIIDETHMLSRSAFNAMLKTLEEPPEHVKFILATTDPQKVPVTVLSRCLQFNLKQIPPLHIAAQLRNILQQEGVFAEPAALALLSHAAQGSMRDALSLLDQAIAHGAGRVVEEAVREMLGVVDRAYLNGLLAALAQGDGAGLLEQADRMAERALSFDAALQDLATLLNRIAVAQVVPQVLEPDDPERGELVSFAQAFTPEEVQLYYRMALQGRDELRLASDEYAAFTMTLLRMLAFRPEEAPIPLAVGPHPAMPASPPAGQQPAAPQARQPGPRDLLPSLSTADWLALIEETKLGGVAGMLARHCHLQSREGNRWTLEIPEAHRHLLEPAYQAKLKAALETRFGGSLRLDFVVGDGEGRTPVETKERQRAEQRNQAIAAIEADPFVRELVEDCDARLVESSIRPLDSISGDNP